MKALTYIEHGKFALMEKRRHKRKMARYHDGTGPFPFVRSVWTITLSESC